MFPYFSERMIFRSTAANICGVQMPNRAENDRMSLVAAFRCETAAPEGGKVVGRNCRCKAGTRASLLLPCINRSVYESIQQSSKY